MEMENIKTVFNTNLYKLITFELQGHEMIGKQFKDFLEYNSEKTLITINSDLLRNYNFSLQTFDDKTLTIFSRRSMFFDPQQIDTNTLKKNIKQIIVILNSLNENGLYLREITNTTFFIDNNNNLILFNWEKCSFIDNFDSVHQIKVLNRPPELRFKFIFNYKSFQTWMLSLFLIRVLNNLFFNSKNIYIGKEINEFDKNDFVSIFSFGFEFFEPPQIEEIISKSKKTISYDFKWNKMPCIFNSYRDDICDHFNQYVLDTLNFDYEERIPFQNLHEHIFLNCKCSKFDLNIIQNPIIQQSSFKIKGIHIDFNNFNSNEKNIISLYINMLDNEIHFSEQKLLNYISIMPKMSNKTYIVYNESVFKNRNLCHTIPLRISTVGVIYIFFEEFIDFCINCIHNKMELDKCLKY
jgi:hypothetical protein